MKLPFQKERERRFAFLLANSKYETLSKLHNPAHDIARIAAELRSIGFEVHSYCDLNCGSTHQYLRDFVAKAGDCDAMVLYYSGHGVQVDGDNYIVPIDFDPTQQVKRGGEDDILLDLVRVQNVMLKMQRATKKLIFLDACRDEGGLKRLRVQRNAAQADEATEDRQSHHATRGVSGLAKLPLKKFEQTMICYAADPGDVAQDGVEGSMSPFSSSVAEHVGIRGLDVFSLSQRIARDVRKMTGGQQVPWSNSNLSDGFSFHPADNMPIWVLGALGALTGFIAAFLNFDLVASWWPLEQGTLKVRNVRDPAYQWVLLAPSMFGCALGLGAYLWGKRKWHVPLLTVLIYGILAAGCRLWFSYYVNEDTIKELGKLDWDKAYHNPGLLLYALLASSVAGAGTVLAAAPFVRDMHKLPRIAMGACVGATAVALMLVFFKFRGLLEHHKYLETSLIVVLFMVWEAALGINVGYAYAKPSND